MRPIPVPSICEHISGEEKHEIRIFKDKFIADDRTCPGPYIIVESPCKRIIREFIPQILINDDQVRLRTILYPPPQESIFGDTSFTVALIKAETFRMEKWSAEDLLAWLVTNVEKAGCSLVGCRSSEETVASEWSFYWLHRYE